MTRDQLARIALRAYPPSVRETDGNEMLSTLLDLSSDGSSAFARELCSLTLAGLNRRAQPAAALGIRRLAADAAAITATLWGLFIFWFALALAFSADHHAQLPRSGGTPQR